MSTSAIVPGSPEHNAAMIALADAQGSQVTLNNPDGTRVTLAAPATSPAVAPAVAPEATATATSLKHERPAHVPEKFWNAETGVLNTEDLLRSYGELERARSAPVVKPSAAPAVTPPAATVTTTPTAEQQAATAKLAAAATPEEKAAAQVELDAANAAVPAPSEPKVTPTLNTAMELAANSFAANGEISEEAFVALEAAGITRQYATNYAAGMKAQAELIEVKMYAEVGGKDNFEAIRAWASVNLSASQKEAHNNALQGTLEASLNSARNLQALYKAANGTAPAARVEPSGGSAAATQKEMFRSQAEVTAAMKDARYSTDAAYRTEVSAKMLAAMNAGIL